MTQGSHVTRYSVMPIPPVEAQTEYFEAGAVTISVEYRLLNDTIAATAELADAGGDDRGRTQSLDDRGVALHVFGIVDGDHLDFDGAESQRFTGRAVAALAADPEVAQRSGGAFAARDLALDYDFRDVDGRLPAGPLHNAAQEE